MSVREDFLRHLRLSEGTNLGEAGGDMAKEAEKNAMKVYCNVCKAKAGTPCDKAAGKLVPGLSIHDSRHATYDRWATSNKLI